MAKAGAGYFPSSFFAGTHLFTIIYQGLTRLNGCRRTDALSHRVEVAKSQGISYAAREGLVVPYPLFMT